MQGNVLRPPHATSTTCSENKHILKAMTFKSMNKIKKLKTAECQVFWARKTGFGQKGLNTDHQVDLQNSKKWINGHKGSENTVDSLSRPGLSRITAYLEVKVWSLPKYANLTTCKKYCGKEEKLLLRSNFSSFPQYFQYISLTSRV